MIGWPLDLVPWWLWFVAAGGALLATLPLWWPAALAIWGALPNWARVMLGGFVTIAAAYLAGRNRGRANERERQRHIDNTAIERRRDSDAAVDAMPPDQRRKEMEEWYRD